MVWATTGWGVGSSSHDKKTVDTKNSTENENQHFTLIFNEASIYFQTIIVNPVAFKFYNYTASFNKGEESITRKMTGSFDSNFDTIVESTTRLDEVERLSKIIGRITASLMLSTSPDTSL